MKLLHANEKEVFYTLDALRGLAAFCVMTYHYSAWLSSKTILPSSYLAVDFFFLLSGFVIAHAYNRRLAEGMSVTSFFRIRLIRLFPIYLLGTVLGVLYVLLRMHVEPGKPVDMLDLGRATLMSAFMLPQMWKSSFPGFFPFDPAAWSLFFEILANIAYAATFRLITTRRLVIFTSLAGLALACTTVVRGSLDIGMTPDTFWSGALRCAFGFGLGTLLYRFRPRRLVAPPEAGIALTFVVFLLQPSLAQRWVYDLCAVLVAFPALLMMSAHTDVGRRRGVFELAALLSYPIYLLHPPLIVIGEGLYKALRHADPALGRPAFGVAMLVVVLLASYVAARWADAPARRFLSACAAKLPTANG